MFPKNFHWGAATASYQIEGGWDADGKGPSIWDSFSHTPGKIKFQATGDMACDHYHRFREDVALMKEMGLKAYRFSLSWPRILPEGTGKVNEKGIAFYRELLLELKAADIVPYVTLYHWDLPQALQDKGGWVNSESAAWFREYAGVVARGLGDLAANFITFNEPSVFIKGIQMGAYAPGITSEPEAYVKAWHHILKAHGLAVTELRKYVKDAFIGCAPTSSVMIPQQEADVEACRKGYFSVTQTLTSKYTDPLVNFVNIPSMFLDPIVFGMYPEDGLEVIEPYLPENWQADMPIISQRIDFIAENIYTGRNTLVEDGVYQLAPKPQGFAKSAFNWAVVPESLYWMPKFIYERYHLPMFISENGIACHDWVSLDGKVHDPNRIDYLNRYLLCLEKAIGDGVDMRGYFVWTLMDNFEWCEGYTQRFGLLHVDFQTQKRTPKDSAQWYREVIETNGVKLHEFD